MFPKFTMRSSTCSAYKHLTFIPYALTNVVEDEGDFIVAEGHEHPLVVRIRGATSQLQIANLLLSLFCTEPTWLACHHKKNLKAWWLLKIECSIWENMFYSSPLNWPIFIGKRRTTFAKSYHIKLRCYWEHIREQIGNKGNLQSHSSGKSKRERLGLLSACCAFSLVACYFHFHLG
jgi:hypothetical protein